MASVPDPQLDRKLDYTGTAGGHSLISVDQRGDHDEELLQEQFAALPRTPDPGGAQGVAHRAYLAAARRRFFFESLDEARWKSMLTYRSGGRFLGLLDGTRPVETELVRLVEAINRGEGLPYAFDHDGDPALALQVRSVPGATVRSHRLFPADRFTLEVGTPAASDYIETSPRELVIRYRLDDGGPSTPGSSSASTCTNCSTGSTAGISPESRTARDRTSRSPCSRTPCPRLRVRKSC